VSLSILEKDVPLAPLTTFGIGGTARYYIHARSEDMALDAVEIAEQLNVPLFVLGGGSNLLVADSGFPGLVLKVGIDGIDWMSDSDEVIVTSGAAEDWDHLVSACVDRDLAGIECLSGIPGTVGGTPVQNIGAYGQEVSDVMMSVRAYDRLARRVTELSRADCRFSYRSSIFNTTSRDRYIVMRVTYRLRRGGRPTLSYADVRRYFGQEIEDPSLAQVRRAVLEIRASKAMLLRAGDPDCRSAGSFFKNPILSEDAFASLELVAAGETVPRYPFAPGKVKTAAAWLIERAGFKKGYTSGRAGLSEKHTLALVNKDGASAEDILRVAREIRSGVENRFGIRLVPEPVFVGFGEDVIDEFFPC
jgi:UDP-N-acetylmuramate dehydrogenase